MKGTARNEAPNIWKLKSWSISQLWNEDIKRQADRDWGYWQWMFNRIGNLQHNKNAINYYRELQSLSNFQQSTLFHIPPLQMFLVPLGEEGRKKQIENLIPKNLMIQVGQMKGALMFLIVKRHIPPVQNLTPTAWRKLGKRQNEKLLSRFSFYRQINRISNLNQWKAITMAKTTHKQVI